MILMLLVMIFPVLGLGLFLWMPWTVALPVYLAGVVVSFFYHRAMRQSRRIPVRTGLPGMRGRSATVIDWAGNRGTVRCQDEIWSARSEDGRHLAPGARVEVVNPDRLILVVRLRDEDGT
jgi:membrane-bound ClpP family serine protease